MGGGVGRVSVQSRSTSALHHNDESTPRRPQPGWWPQERRPRLRLALPSVRAARLGSRGRVLRRRPRPRLTARPLGHPAGAKMSILAGVTCATGVRRPSLATSLASAARVAAAASWSAICRAFRALSAHGRAETQCQRPGPSMSRRALTSLALVPSARPSALGDFSAGPIGRRGGCSRAGHAQRRATATTSTTSLVARRKRRRRRREQRRRAVAPVESALGALQGSGPRPLSSTRPPTLVPPAAAAPATVAAVTRAAPDPATAAAAPPAAARGDIVALRRGARAPARLRLAAAGGAATAAAAPARTGARAPAAAGATRAATAADAATAAPAAGTGVGTRASGRVTTAAAAAAAVAAAVAAGTGARVAALGGDEEMGARPWRRREPGLGEAPPCVGSRTLTSMHRRALVVGNGAAGAEKQALALARALGDPSPGVYRTPFRSWAERVPAAWACPVLHRGGPKAARVPGFAETVGDLPRGAYVVGCGRSVAGLVAAVSRLGCVPRSHGSAAWFTSHVPPQPPQRPDPAPTRRRALV